MGSRSLSVSHFFFQSANSALQESGCAGAAYCTVTFASPPSPRSCSQSFSVMSCRSDAASEPLTMV